MIVAIADSYSGITPKVGLVHLKAMETIMIPYYNLMRHHAANSEVLEFTAKCNDIEFHIFIQKYYSKT